MSFGLFPIAGEPIAGYPSPPRPRQTLIEGLRAFLAATAAVTNLTGANVSPMQSKQGAPSPRLTLKRTAEADDDTLDKGHTKSPTATVEITCYGGAWGGGYATARQLANAVRNADGGL